jgi:hypothetical protein
VTSRECYIAAKAANLSMQGFAAPSTIIRWDTEGYRHRGSPGPSLEGGKEATPEGSPGEGRQQA